MEIPNQIRHVLSNHNTYLSHCLSRNLRVPYYFLALDLLEFTQTTEKKSCSMMMYMESKYPYHASCLPFYAQLPDLEAGQLKFFSLLLLLPIYSIL